MACNKCGGSGYAFTVDEHGYSFASQCSCATALKPIVGTRADSRHFAYAAQTLIEVVCGPKSMRRHVAEWLASNIATVEELERFQRHALEYLSEWRGISGLRELLENFRGRERMKAEDIARDRKIAEWKANG